MEKEFGKLTRDQLLEYFKHYNEIDSSKNELLADDNLEKLDKYLKDSIPWAIWYDLDFETHLAILLWVIGFGGTLREIVKKDDPQQELLDHLKLEETFSLDDDELSDVEIGIVIGLVFALMKQLECISVFHVPISKLLRKARNGDVGALFDAVIIDRSVVSSLTASRLIQSASMTNDEAFLNDLAKAITKTRTKPRRPKKSYDALRYFIEVIDESVGLKNISMDDKFDLLANDMGLYPTEGREDPYQGLKELIKRRNKKIGT